ncbi:AAA family ATPase [Vibrio sp. SNU_ST1]|uniref:ATP-dependent nuclease n=1 Tax=Vibrio sp. SNU_ST1 TaxID=3064001 RepID=UPI002729A239|nr:AAA family ATPase [Vibrio sp. SNU_ST1]WKY60672.1 AAA family ATPase [Vibrio sp. SNU_ST1]
MIIDKVKLKGFRNFADAEVNFNGNSLIMGANDVGKTNLIFALRLLLDKSLSERDLEPLSTDFHVNASGSQVENYEIVIFFKDIVKDSARSILKGYVSESDSTVFCLNANIMGEYQVSLGPDLEHLEVVQSRFYLKYINLKYVQSRRDLKKFIDLEKKHLLKIAKDERSEMESQSDADQTALISKSLATVNQQIKQLNYVKSSTSLVNAELKSLSHINDQYSVRLDTGSIQVDQFIDNLQLGAEKNGSALALGGDGRNNQILLALWKAKSEREFDPNHHVTFYCVEEPEAHLHPHQQRRLATYLNESLSGQVFITSHSPQIVEKFQPSSIVRLLTKAGHTIAASDGCSNCIDTAWDELGYRMSILPAEAFFSSCVFLVEGPSEELFYHELAKAIGIKLDFYNISILSVDGVQFRVYANILEALEIPYVIRTDNDVSKVPRKEEKRLAGIIRCTEIAKVKGLDCFPVAPVTMNATPESIVETGIWSNYSSKYNPLGLYLAKVDLETDLYDELPTQMKEFSDKQDKNEVIEYLKSKKAINMRKFIKSYQSDFAGLSSGLLAQPLLQAIQFAK